MQGLFEYLTDPLIIGVIAIVLCILAVAGYALYKRSRTGNRQPVFVIGNVDIDRRRLLKDQFTAKDEKTLESWFLEGDAYRRRASHGHEMVQFVPAWSATPLFPGQPVKYRDDRAGQHSTMLTELAVKFARRERQNVSKVQAQLQQHQTYKYAIIGTVIVVIVVSIVILLVGKVF